MSNQMTQPVDVLVVGGGPAGLSAAVTLARSRRSVLVVDAGQPRNATAGHAHNVLGQEGVAPADLLARGRAEATGYGAQVRDARVLSVRRDGDGFVAEVSDGGTVRARRLLLATGLVDELPDVPGVREGWGTTVLHCPFCHGWEVRDQRIGVLGTGPGAVHQSLLFSRLSDRVQLLRHTVDALEPDALAQLVAAGVDVVAGRVERLVHEGAALRGAVLADGSTVELDAVVVAPTFTASTGLYEQLGGEPRRHPTGWTDIPVGERGASDLAGVWVAGNVADLAGVVVAAMAQGVGAAAGIHFDLLQADLAAATAA